jgi:hypothetical protein
MISVPPLQRRGGTELMGPLLHQGQALKMHHYLASGPIDTA